MDTIVARVPAPHMGARMLITGVAALLVGGVAGGLVQWTLQPSGESAAIPASVPAEVGSTTFSPEAVRAQNFTRVNEARLLSPEAIRAQNYSLAPQEALSQVQATAAREAVIRELRAEWYRAHSAQELFSPEAIRAQSYTGANGI